MLSCVLLTVAIAASTAVGVALPKEGSQEIVASNSKAVYNLVSPDGTCGGATHYTCLGSDFGDCCNTDGYCGSSAAFCGAFCFGPAGFCSSDAVTSSIKETTTGRPEATHKPWKPTPHRDPHFKPSYKIDNGERAPNQVWS